jgi:zinc/manganese transport system substrate-binding protein
VVWRGRAIKRFAVAGGLAALLASCSSAGAAGGGAGLQVVAAENFWGSIASQLAGTKAHVTSIITNPAQDPHSYEPTSADARTLVTANLAIVNGIGYDPWAPKILTANPVPGRVVLNVGNLFRLSEGENPHRWYDPADVSVVAYSIAEELIKLDPKDASYFHRRLLNFDTKALAAYHQLILAIRSRYAGVPVGASESIFALQAPALGLRLITPSGFMRAISEGSEPTAQDIAAVESQVADEKVKVWIYNTQNSTPAVERLNELAVSRGIPIATITETLSPASDSFEQWQVTQLRHLERALHQATGR